MPNVKVFWYDTIQSGRNRSESRTCCAIHRGSKRPGNQRVLDFAASRTYYGAFYAATAVLLSEGIELSKHSGVIASIHQRFVKTGKLSKEYGKDLNWLFEMRSVGDYGGIAHVSQQQAEHAIEAAASFVDAINALLQRQ